MTRHKTTLKQLEKSGISQTEITLAMYNPGVWITISRSQAIMFTVGKRSQSWEVIQI